jgi:hypothetical protein
MFLHERYTLELKKIHRADVDPKSVPFNIADAYAVGGGTLHGRFVEVSIFFG